MSQPFDGNIFDNLVFDADDNTGDTAAGQTLRARRRSRKTIDYGPVIKNRVGR